MSEYLLFIIIMRLSRSGVFLVRYKFFLLANNPTSYEGTIKSNTCILILNKGFIFFFMSTHLKYSKVPLLLPVGAKIYLGLSVFASDIRIYPLSTMTMFYQEERSQVERLLSFVHL